MKRSVVLTVLLAVAFAGCGSVFPIGNPGYSGDGWDGGADGVSSNGWIRQVGYEPYAKPEMVTFTGGTGVMGSCCPTVAASIAPNDPTAYGGKAQRAQVIVGDNAKDTFGHTPGLGIVRGQTWYYMFAFSTNSAYRPQTRSDVPQWNIIQAWHGYGPSYYGGPGVIVATQRQSEAGTYLGDFPDGRPHLQFEVLGESHCAGSNVGEQRHYYDPQPFVAGRRYVIRERITWNADNRGAFVAWIDNRLIVAKLGVSTLSCDYGAYFEPENYRPYPNGLTNTNTVYYGGLVKGRTALDVGL